MIPRLPTLALTLMVLLVLVTGFCIIGGQPAVNALAATYYPTALRSTGVGWSLGVGRVGSIVGPVLGGRADPPEVCWRRPETEPVGVRGFLGRVMP